MPQPITAIERIASSSPVRCNTSPTSTTGIVAIISKKASFAPAVSIRPVSMRGTPKSPIRTSDQK